MKLEKICFSERYKRSDNLMKNLKIGTIISGAFFLFLLSTRSPKTTYEIGKEVYQGYHRANEDFPSIYVFDPNPYWKRSGSPRYVLEGGDELQEKLEIGETYFFVIKNTEKRFLLSILSPPSRGEIVYIKPVSEIEKLINQEKDKEDFQISYSK